MVRLDATIELEESVKDIDLKNGIHKLHTGYLLVCSETAIRLKGTIWRTTNRYADAYFL